MSDQFTNQATPIAPSPQSQKGDDQNVVGGANNSDQTSTNSPTQIQQPQPLVSPASQVSPIPSSQQTTPSLAQPNKQQDALSVLEAAIAQASQQSDVARQAAEKTLQQAAEETGELAQVLPNAILSATDTLNPAAPTTTAKEAEGLKSPDKSNQAEAGTGVQAVEVEKNPELPPEVEGFINKVEQQADQLPKEIVIADAIKNLPQHHPLPKQPVVVLPITPEIEKVGATKSPKFSVRWLVEWSRRIMKMFMGKVIYRQT